MPCQSITEATSNENQNTNRDKRLHFLKMSGIYNNPFSALIFTTMSLKCHKLMMKTIIWWLGGQRFVEGLISPEGLQHDRSKR